jgi:hypothetical protein
LRCFKELKTQSILEEIDNYKSKWIQHVNRVDRSMLLHAITKYQPAGEESTGLQYRDFWIMMCIETGTGHEA